MVRRARAGGPSADPPEQFLAISPQTIPEARNRGYRPHRSIRVCT